MKTYQKILWRCLALLLLCPLCLCGCSRQEVPAPTAEAELTARVTELEAALARLREETFISEAAYEAEIKALEDRLALFSDRETAGETVAEELVLHYRLESGNAVITGFSGASDIISVPAVLDGHPVTAIGERAFEGSDAAAVILPESLVSIGWFAFYGCERLSDICIPAGVTAIGYGALDACPYITVVCAPDSYAAAYAKSYGIAVVSPRSP